MLVLLGSLSTAAAQQTLYVDAVNCPGPGTGTPANPYCKIQDAICYLKNNVPAGGTVLVRPGTYAEAVRIFGGISVVSTDGPAVTTINASGKPCILSTCAPNTATTQCTAVQATSVSGVGPTSADRIQGFHITGGKGYVWTTGTISSVGGGIFVWGNSSPTITQNEIVGNSLAATTTKLFYGGGIYIGSNIGGGQVPARPVITQNLIEGNVADPPAGTNNSPSYGIGGGIYSGFDAAPAIDGNTIRSNRGGGALKSNQISAGGGIAMYGRAAAGSPLISRNLIQVNTTTNWAGGLQAGGFTGGTGVLNGVGIVENNVFDGNSSTLGGGAHTSSTTIAFRNNTFVNNVASYGGAVYLEPGSTTGLPTLANNLLTFNSASKSSGGGGVCVGGAFNPIVRYNDLYGNTPQNVACTKSDSSYIAVNGNMSADPQFVDRANKDFHLLSSSPVIDVGENANGAAQDRDGAPRPQDGDYVGGPVVDMGAYEFSPDYDRDGIPDWQDPDMDNDGVPNAQDCAPLNAAVWSPPIEVQGLRVDKAAATRLGWTAQGQAPYYDVAGGALSDLRSGQGTNGATCLRNDDGQPAWDDGSRPDPSPGQGYYYLVRAQDVCGSGTYGFASTGGERRPSTDCP